VVLIAEAFLAGTADERQCRVMSDREQRLAAMARSQCFRLNIQLECSSFPLVKTGSVAATDPVSPMWN
jgi:hypothetical protein